MSPPGVSVPGLPSEPLTRPRGIVGPIPLAAVFQGWELVHFASKAKRYGVLDNEGRLALYEMGRLRMRAAALDPANAVRQDDLLSALVLANLGDADCDRGECEACGRLAVLTADRPVSRPAAELARPPPPPAEPLRPEPVPLFAPAPSRIAGLRFSPHNPEVLSKVRDGIIEDSGDWVLHYRALLLGVRSGFDELLCLPLIRGARHYDYQVDTALKVLREMRGRAILADEVGLGKTIEAGIVLKELVVRGLARKVLILTPASLVVQWQEEMTMKFGLDFEIMDEFEDWARHDLVISSIDTAKRDVHREEIERLSYDVVIVDEAHRLKNRATKNWRLVASARQKYILLLTATPVQNDLDELFNVVTLLRPGQLSSYGGFRERFLRRGDRRTPTNPRELRRLLKEVMIRNRRGSVLVLPPPRGVPPRNL